MSYPSPSVARHLEAEVFKAAFLKAMGERALKTFAQSLIAVGLVGATGILDVDWGAALSTAALATVLSVLSSIVSYPVGDKGPALGTEAQVDSPVAG